MTKDEIFIAVTEIFRDIFDDKQLCISDATSAADIEDWDSLNHILLVSAMEKAFAVKFALGELMDIKNVGEMITLIMTKQA